MTTQQQILEKAITPKLGEIGNDQYIFVMYDVKSITQNNKWYANIVINLTISAFQNICYTLIKRTGVSFAKYIYPRLLKSYLSQLPLQNVIQIAIDLTHIGQPQNEINQHLENIIQAQLQLLNPHLTINDAKEFLNELGKQVLENPPSKHTI